MAGPEWSATNSRGALVPHLEWLVTTRWVCWSSATMAAAMASPSPVSLSAERYPTSGRS